MISIALFEPKIPQNTGNIARLAVGLDIDLYLVGKLGFSLNDKYLKRAGLDYWQNLRLHVFDDLEQFLTEKKDSRIVLASTKGRIPYFKYSFNENDIILFGSETSGLPVDLIKDNIENTITLPMPGKVRSINLSNSAAVLAYHALLDVGYFNNFSYNTNYLDLNL